MSTPSIGGKVLDASAVAAIVEGRLSGYLDPRPAAAVGALLRRLGKFDALAGHVVHEARRRGWPVLTADPGRLHRLDPGLEADPL